MSSKLTVSVRVDNDRICVTEPAAIVSGGKNYYELSAVFTGDWDGLSKELTLSVNDGPCYALPLTQAENDSRTAAAVIPEALLTEDGFLTLGAVGRDGGNIRITTDTARLKVLAGTVTGADVPPLPRNVWEKYVDEQIGDAIKSTMLPDDAVTEPKLADKAVSADKLQAGSVTQPKIQDGAVTEGKIRDGSVSESKLSADLLAKLSSLGGAGDVGFNFKGDLKKITLQEEGGAFASEFNAIWALDGRQSGTVVISSETKEKSTVVYGGLAAGAAYRFAEDGDIPLSVRYKEGKEAEFKWINVKFGDVWKYCGLSMKGDLDFVEEIGLSPNDTDTDFKWEYLGNVATADDLKAAIDDSVTYAECARTYLLRHSERGWEEVGFDGSPKSFSASSIAKGSVLRFLDKGTFEHRGYDGLYSETESVSVGDEWRFNGFVNFGDEFDNPIGEDWDYLGNAAPSRRVRHYVGGTVDASASCECVAKKLFILTFDADDAVFGAPYSAPMYCLDSADGGSNIDWPSDDIVIAGVSGQGMFVLGGGVASRYRVVAATSASEAGAALERLISGGGASFGLWFETLCYYFDKSTGLAYTANGQAYLRNAYAVGSEEG